MDLKDKCGVFGVVAKEGHKSENIAKVSYTGLFQLQHRGRESAGISVYSSRGAIVTHKGMGTIDWVFREQELEINPLDDMDGNAAIGHVRYSTTGMSGAKNAQPLIFKFQGRDAALGHNGNLVRTEKLEQIVQDRGGYEREDTSDTGIITALIATSGRPSFMEALRETLNLLEGAFSLVVLYEGRVYAAKDKFGIRPLSIARSNGHLFAASESRALDNFRAEFLGELDPGTIAVLEPNFDYPQVIRWSDGASLRRCVFEDAYFSMPDSLGAGDTRIMAHRKNLGAEAAREHPIFDADVVMPVLDSGLFQGMGYAQELEMMCHKKDIEVPLEGFFQYAFIRGRVERTFMEPIADARRLLQNLKFRIIPEVVRGKHVVVVDDSIVRGTVMPYIIDELRFFGARKVSVIIPFPPLRHPCHLGIDLPYREDYAAHNRTVKEIARAVGLRPDDGEILGYLSLEGLYKALSQPRDNFCDGCLTNEYPVPLPDELTYKPK